jgi:hypothetical protein
MQNKNAVWFRLILIIAFILPMVTFILTSYTIYLKSQMNQLTLKIEELEFYNNYSSLENQAPTSNPIEELKLPEIEIGSTKAEVSYNIQELDFHTLLNNSVSLLKPYNPGSVRIFYNQRQAYEEALFALENEIPYFIFENENKYYLYRADYDLQVGQDLQNMLSIQIRLYNSPAPVVFPNILLRQANIPAFVYNGKYPQSKEDYWSILIGFFEDKNEAQRYLQSMDVKMISDLTGFDIKDRFVKDELYFQGTDN